MIAEKPKSSEQENGKRKQKSKRKKKLLWKFDLFCQIGCAWFIIYTYVLWFW